MSELRRLKAHTREQLYGDCETVVPLPDGTHVIVHDYLEEFEDENGDKRKRMPEGMTQRHVNWALADHAKRRGISEKLREKAKGNPKAAVELADVLALLGEG